MNSLRQMRRVLAGALMVAAACWAFAQDGGESGDKEAQAKEVLQRLSSYVSGLNGFGLNATLTVRTETGGETQERIATYAVAVERPNKFSLQSSYDKNELRIVNDGGKLYVYLSEMGKYAEVDGVSKLGEILPAARIAPDMALVFIHILLQDDLNAALTAGVERVTYEGKEDIEGVPCHHLHLANPKIDRDLWVEAGEKPLPRKFALPPQKSGETTATLALAISGWAANPTYPPDQFRFIPPEGAEKTVWSPMPPSGRPEGPHPLLGVTAPDFTLNLLDGSKVDLAALKQNKTVVILDFWATWCAPCKRSMPFVAAIAKDYKEKGVAAYFVNLGDDADAIRKFLADLKLDVAVPMDADGHVGDLYKADAIPQMVVIGKDGVVQVVHTGFPIPEDTLRKQLDALVEGKSLIEKAPQEQTQIP